MRRARWSIGVVIALACCSGTATAVQPQKTQTQTPPQPGTVCQLCRKAAEQSGSYSSKAGYTFARGAANTALGWTELFRQPVDEAKAGGNVVVGIGKGIGATVTRTLGGLGEMLTFWTPKVEGRYVHFSKDCPICMGRQQAQQAATAH